MKKYLSLLSVLLLVGCSSSWSTASVDPSTVSSQTQSNYKSENVPVNPADVIITEGNITDRKYEVLGDLNVTVNKTTIFHKDPTPELVNEKLQAKAAEMGADAVILVRYGTVGVSLVSWGSLDGKGRAVKFVN